MSTNDIHTERDAALVLALGRWTIIEGLDPDVVEMPPVPLPGATWLTFRAMDESHMIMALFAPNGVLMGTQRATLEDGHATYATKIDLTQVNGYGVFARLAVRLASPQLAEFPDTFPEDWSKGTGA